MKVSVLTTTYRDIAQLLPQVESLTRQEMAASDFEWIIVDDHWTENQEVVAGWDTSFDLVHVPPRNVVAQAAGCAAINSGLIYCRGELVFTMADYVQPTVPVLNRHWEIFELWGPKLMISGPLVPWECPECARRAGRQWCLPDEAFIVPCHGGCERDIVMSRTRPAERFLDELDSSCGEILSPLLLAQAFWVGRNDSFGLEAALDVNGMDERLDGYNKGGDSEFGRRLMQAGCRYIIDRLTPCIIYPHVRGKTDVEPDSKGDDDERQILNLEVQKGRLWADHGWNIREERAKTLGLEVHR